LSQPNRTNYEAVHQNYTYYDSNWGNYQANPNSLLQLTKSLVSTLNEEKIINTLTEYFIPKYADWCRIELFDPNGNTSRVFTSHNNTEDSKHLSGLANELLPALHSNRSKACLWEEVCPSFWLHSLSPSLCGSRALEQFVQRPIGYLGIPLVAPEEDHILNGRVNDGAKNRSVDKPIGIVSCVRLYPNGKYTRADLEALQDIGYIAGHVLGNIQSYENSREQISLKDLILATASHEFRTPLTSLYLQLQLIQKYLVNPHSSPIPVDYIEGQIKNATLQIKHLEILIDNLLDISPYIHGKWILKKEKVDLGLLAEEIIHRLRPMAKEAGSQIQLEVHGSVEGFWDRNRLEQAIINLITNAIKYGESKPITVSACPGQQNCPPSAMITVKDQGPGIPAQDHVRIFDRYVRAATPRQLGIRGTGLGLYIAKQIVDAHGGAIRVESELNKGSAFTIELPTKN